MVIGGRDSTRCSATITDGSTRYTITGLEEASSYTITVTATNAAGNAACDPVSIVTEKVGKQYVLCTTVPYWSNLHLCFYYHCHLDQRLSGGMTVLNDPVTAHYTHTLTVTGRLGRHYQCNVSKKNNVITL